MVNCKTKCTTSWFFRWQWYTFNVCIIKKSSPNGLLFLLCTAIMFYKNFFGQANAEWWLPLLKKKYEEKVKEVRAAAGIACSSTPSSGFHEDSDWSSPEPRQSRQRIPVKSPSPSGSAGGSACSHSRLNRVPGDHPIFCVNLQGGV